MIDVFSWFKKQPIETPISISLSTNELAPIALFTYNRLWHTQQTINALLKNPECKDSVLYIFSDGPKNDETKLKIKELREYLNTIIGFKAVHIIPRNENFGLAKSIINGVGEILSKHPKVIVLEDDLVTSPCFLNYMNIALKIYENEDDVISIHGYTYPVKAKLPNSFFIKGADCWGWATWPRGWKYFEADGTKLLSQLESTGLQRRLDYDGTYPFTKMLKDQIAGKNNSWAIRWAASAILNNKLTLYPGRSLVENIGFDNSGTHCSETSDYKVSVSKDFKLTCKLKPKENPRAYRTFKKYFNSIR